MSTNGDVTEDYQKLLDYGIDATVATELDSIYQAGILAHSDLDARALDALKEFSSDKGVAVLKEFRDSNLEHVSNKSAYLCGVMKAYRQKMKMQQMGETPDVAAAKKPGPDEEKLKEILERTGYSLDVTVGQRKYGGPPPDGDINNPPGMGHEIFCGKIPKEVFEDELIPLFEQCGEIWDLRLMMDPLTGLNRGYCFVTFNQKESAREAVKTLDNYEIKPGKKIKINISVANVRLFVGNIPKSKSKDEIQEEFSKLTENLSEVIIYADPENPNKKNRGFAFLEYISHKDASIAKRRIGNGRTRVWGCDIIVDWADPVDEPDEETMAKVKVLYVRKLASEVTEEQLKEKFEPYGTVERVKKVKDFGFVHFENREDAIKAMEALNGQDLSGQAMDVSLAKPASEAKQKQKMKRQEQARMMHMGGFDDPYYYGGAPPRMPMGRMGPRQMMPPAYDMYDDFYDPYGGYGETYGFDDYGMADLRRGRGAMMGYGRGRGGAAARGGSPFRGGGMRGAQRGMRGGNRGMNRGGNRGGGMKRKVNEGGFSGAAKKQKNTQDSWGSQPIAQQPLRNQTWF